MVTRQTVGSSDGPTELSQVVDDLLASLTTKFTGVSNEILAKMDDMSRRLDHLEAVVQSGVEDKGKSSA
jgi:heat shock factor-binding protein 1